MAQRVNLNDVRTLLTGYVSKQQLNEYVDDRVAALIQDGTGISWSYDDEYGKLTPTVSLAGLAPSTDHGGLAGLSDDDHTQYHNNTRGDARYKLSSDFINASLGVASAGAPIVLDAAGHVDSTMLNMNDIDHGQILGLSDDDHTQYSLVDGTRNITGDQRFNQAAIVDGSGHVGTNLGVMGNLDVEDDVTIGGSGIVEGDLRVRGSLYGDGSNLTGISGASAPAQIVTVAQSGGDYTTIQGAIDSITDAASNKKYTVQVYPGTYTENVVMKDHVSLHGMCGSRGQCEITNSSGTVLTAQTGSNNVVRNIKIKATGTAESVNLPAGMGSSWIQFWNCSIETGYGAHADDMITINSGQLQLINSVLAYVSTGGSDTHRLLHVVGASQQIYVVNCLISTNIDDTGSNRFTGFELDSGANCDVLITQNAIECDNEMTGAGSCLYHDNDTIGTCDRRVTMNYFHLEGAAGASGVIACLEDVATECETSNNTVTVEGFDYNLAASVGAAATWNTTFDDLHIDPEIYVGTGTANIVNVDEHGKLNADEATIPYIEVTSDQTALVAGETATALDVRVLTTGSTGGDFHALDITKAGDGSANITAVGAHTDVDVIHQHIGVPTVDTVWDHDVTDGEYNNVEAAGSGIMVHDNDILYVGEDAIFDEVQFIFSTPSSQRIFQTTDQFAYWNGAWTSFTPEDDTDGFTQDGSVRFNGDDLSGWTTTTVSGDTKYFIRITRTRNSISTIPVLTSAKVVIGAEYTWNSDGDLSVNDTTAAGSGIVAGDIRGRADLRIEGTIYGDGTGITGAGVSDHGALTGLSDDDHTQYVLATGTRNITGDMEMEQDLVVDASGHYGSDLGVMGDFTVVGTSTLNGGLTTEGDVVINEAGDDHNFRVEASNNTTGLVLDAGAFSGQGALGVGANPGSLNDKIYAYINAGAAYNIVMHNAANTGIAAFKARSNQATEFVDFGVAGNSYTTPAFADYAYIYTETGLNGLRIFTNGANARTTWDNTGQLTHTGDLIVSGSGFIGDTLYTDTVSSTATQDLTLQTAGTDRITVDKDAGYVGIGTTTPLGKLDIQGDNGDGEIALRVRAGSGASTAMDFDTDAAFTGNFAVIRHNGNTRVQIDGTAGGRVIVSDGVYGGIEAGSTGFTKLTSTNGLERLRMGSGGLVWNEDARDYDFRWEGKTDANLLVLDAALDSIGIGELTPDAKLEIDGDIHITDSGWVDGDWRVRGADISESGLVQGNLTVESDGVDPERITTHLPEQILLYEPGTGATADNGANIDATHIGAENKLPAGSTIIGVQFQHGSVGSHINTDEMTWKIFENTSGSVCRVAWIDDLACGGMSFATDKYRYFGSPFVVPATGDYFLGIHSDTAVNNIRTPTAGHTGNSDANKYLWRTGNMALDESQTFTTNTFTMQFAPIYTTKTEDTPSPVLWTDRFGMVGVRTKTPSTTLDVHGTFRARGSADGTLGIFVDNEGNVGLGSDPDPVQGNVHVAGDLSYEGALLLRSSDRIQHYNELRFNDGTSSGIGHSVLKTNPSATYGAVYVAPIKGSTSTDENIGMYISGSATGTGASGDVELQKLFYTRSGGGTDDNAHYILMKSATKPGGTITNLYGLKIEDQTVGTNNYAIYTGLGDVRIGDDLYVVGSGTFDSALLTNDTLYVQTTEVPASPAVEVSISAASMKGAYLNPAGDDDNGLPETGENSDTGLNYDYIAFDSGTIESAFFQYSLPTGWDEGTITYRAKWTATEGDADHESQDVTWGLKATAIGDGDSLGTTEFGTEVTVTDDWIANSGVHISADSSTITIGGTPEEGDMVFFQVSRQVDSDNLYGDARLLELILTFNRDSYSD